MGWNSGLCSPSPALCPSEGRKNIVPTTQALAQTGLCLPLRNHVTKDPPLPPCASVDLFVKGNVLFVKKYILFVKIYFICEK